MENKYLKLGKIVTDNVANVDGMLTILCVDMSGNITYVFQPSLLNKRTKAPVDTYWICGERIINGENVEIDLPIEILGTQVKDKATGFIGTAIDIYYYINGCIHINVKPSGTIDETGETIKAYEFDIRRLEGEFIVEMSDEELDDSRKTNPSPEHKPNLNCK